MRPRSSWPAGPPAGGLSLTRGTVVSHSISPVPYGLGGLVMQQISAMHPAWAELSPAELPSAELPLAGPLREWTAAWRRGEALGQRIARDLVFTSLLDVLPCSGSQRALAGASGRGLRALSYARLHEFV